MTRRDEVISGLTRLRRGMFGQQKVLAEFFDLVEDVVKAPAECAECAPAKMTEDNAVAANEGDQIGNRAD